LGEIKPSISNYPDRALEDVRLAVKLNQIRLLIEPENHPMKPVFQKKGIPLLRPEGFDQQIF
jgi:hypothetical protein